MKIFFTIKEGGAWKAALVTRKELNSIIKGLCNPIFGCNYCVHSLCLKNIIYDRCLFTELKTNQRPSYYKLIERNLAKCRH